jgi:hypothetical protein
MDGARILCVNVVMEMLAKRLIGAHGKPTCGQAEGKYLLHLVVVINRIIQVLCVLDQ